MNLLFEKRGLGLFLPLTILLSLYFLLLFKFASLTEPNLFLLSVPLFLFFIFAFTQRLFLLFYFTFSVTLTALGILPNLLGAYPAGGALIVDNILFFLTKKNWAPKRNPLQRLYLYFFVFFSAIYLSSLFTLIKGTFTLATLRGIFDLSIFFLVIYSLQQSIKELSEVKRLVLFSLIITLLTSLIWLPPLVKASGKSLSLPLRQIGLNEMGNWFGLLTVLVVALLLSEKGQKKRLFLGLTFATIFLGLILSKSRGAWLGVIVGLTYLFIKTKSFKLLLYLILGTGILILFKPATLIFLGRFQETSFADVAFLERIVIWRVAFSIIQNNFLTGIGIHNFGLIKYDYGFPSFLDPFGSLATSTFSYGGPKEVLYGHTHNLYVELLMNLGILGLIAFLLILFFLLQGLTKSLSEVKEEETKGILLGLSAVIIAFLVHSLFDYFFWIPASLIFFGWFLGLATATLNLLKSRSELEKFDQRSFPR